MNRNELNLRAGCKYLTVKLDGTAGPVFTLEPVGWSNSNKILNAVIPFNAQGSSQNLVVTPHGEVYEHGSGELLFQITGEYREPTIAERLEEWFRDHDTRERFERIVADVRKLEGGK